MNDPLDSLRIRPGEPGDYARVRKDWTLSYAVSDFARYCTPRADWQARASELFWSWQREVIDRLLREAELWVACWAEDTTTIVGWCVLEDAGRLVHYVAVGNDFRMQGVAKRLLAPALEHSSVTYTHRTTVCRRLPIPPGWKFDPRPALVPRRTEEKPQ